MNKVIDITPKLNSKRKDEKQDPYLLKLEEVSDLKDCLAKAIKELADLAEDNEWALFWREKIHRLSGYTDEESIVVDELVDDYFSCLALNRQDIDFDT